MWKDRKQLWAHTSILSSKPTWATSHILVHMGTHKKIFLKYLRTSWAGTRSTPGDWQGGKCWAGVVHVGMHRNKVRIGPLAPSLWLPARMTGSWVTLAGY